MKKIFTMIFAVSLMAASVSAQGFRLGVTAGLELSNMLLENDLLPLDPSARAGLKVGVVAEYAFNEFFAIAPELVFAQRGFKVDRNFFGARVEAATRINYFQLPINMIVGLPVGQNFRVFALAGPYIGCALSGSVSAKTTAFGQVLLDESQDIEFGSGDDEMKRFDFGLNFGAGIEFKGAFLKMQYNLGLTNLSNVTAVREKNRNFGISVGYMFSF